MTICTYPLNNMKYIKIWCASIVVIVLATATYAYAYADGSDWQFSYKPASVNYTLYSGTISEPIPPKGKQKNLSFEINGEAAKDIFNSIGPDVKNSCPASDNERVRERADGNIRCYLQAKNKYQCYFGVNLQTGKIIPGDIC